MPSRQQVIVSGEVYHAFNRSVGKIPIFENKTDYSRALEVISFYIYRRPSLSFSRYNRLSLDQKRNFYQNLQSSSEKIVEILAFCLMPNHVHFLLKEIQDGGITSFMRNFQNSYAKYFNTKSDRNGSVFQIQFKASRVETDEHLLHIARYIHLNPLTSYLIKEAKDLDRYFWSSWPDYLGLRDGGKITTPNLIMSYFSSPPTFKEFTLDQVEYQRSLWQIKKLTLE